MVHFLGRTGAGRHSVRTYTTNLRLLTECRPESVYFQIKSNTTYGLVFLANTPLRSCGVLTYTMFSLLPYFLIYYCELYIHLHNVGKSQISDLKHMGKNITFGIYKNILQLNNMGENGPRDPGRHPRQG